MSDSTVRVDVDDGVAHLELARPDRRNALVGPMVDELIAAVRDTRDSSRVLLLTGEGRHLCAGLDVDAFSADPPPSWRESFSERWAELHGELWTDDRPLVVAHTGAAVGAGGALLFAADVAVSGLNAFVHLIEVPIGMVAPVNLAWIVARHSHAVAGTIGLLAERTAAAELHRLGLVAEVVEDGDVADRARERAHLLASYPPSAVAGTRRALRRLGGCDLAAMIAAAQSEGTGALPRRDTT